MANRLSLKKKSSTSILIILLILLDGAFVWEQVRAIPVKRNDILAGTEFLSVFINGAIAPTPRRRGYRRGNIVQDNVAAESRHNEASIFRISRAPSNLRSSTLLSTTIRPNNREITDKYYQNVNQKGLNHHQSNLPSTIDDIGTTEEIGIRLKPPTPVPISLQINRDLFNKNNSNKFVLGKNLNRKVIGVSVTSTVEATPYKVRVEHYDNDEQQLSMLTRPPVEPSSSSTFSSSTLTSIRTSKSPSIITTNIKTTSANPSSTTSPAKLVTEELSNIVSESNRSEFLVDEELPKTDWHVKSSSASSITPKSIIQNSTPYSTSSTSFLQNVRERSNDSLGIESSSELVEQSYEMQEENSETSENNHELKEIHSPQGRKVGRHYDGSIFNQPSKVYQQPKIYGKSSQIYSEPAKIYSEPAKIYGEPAKVYGEPEKVYSEPSKVYSEPARVYGEPSKVYSEPARVYGEPAKIYGSHGEPIEQNYEVDEAVSVGSNGNVHGPQIITEAPNASAVDDGHKVGYVVEGRNYRKYRVEERTPDGFIVGEYGVVSHNDGSLRGVRYTADGTINPRLIYDALMKFLAL